MKSTFLLNFLSVFCFLKNYLHVKHICKGMEFEQRDVANHKDDDIELIRGNIEPVLADFETRGLCLGTLFIFEW